MTSHARKVVFVVVLIAGVLGAVASIVALTNPLRFWFAGCLVIIVAIAVGYLLALAMSPTIEMIPRRPAVSLDTELGNAKEVWFSWHTGSVKVAQGDLFKSPRIIRMVLTHPDSQALKEVAKIANLTADQMAPGIRALTAAVKNAGQSVRWFDGPVANSIVVADPDKPSGWARIEVLLPFGDPASRPSIFVRASSAPDLFARAKEAFNKLFDGSAPQ